ncbi:MAG: site-specific DNA-methyltransferase [Actinomycetota bacterium]|nr:site-specific DNA-methyltransferase [Actinomycetota bacterium]
MHSLCSYQGKLKPAIAHFLVRWFTSPTDVVLDPMAGVGTIPLEARLQGRLALGGDLSELAAVVSRAKVEQFRRRDIETTLAALGAAVAYTRTTDEDLISDEHASFGLNGPIEEYFERRTLREILIARRFFRERLARMSAAEAVVASSLLHILHGNRPYALSRRSHPVTPFKPSGPVDYRPLMDRLVRRLDRVVNLLLGLPAGGHSYLSDFATLPVADQSVDTVITSPPFAQSLRFFSSNWMRLWFCGWCPDDFRKRPDEFLERKQRTDFDGAYQGFLRAMHRVIRPGGLLVMHLGVTRDLDMAARIIPQLSSAGFSLIHLGRERVADTETHGLTDKGATVAHGFVFARAI